eukprot:TRINITY_DN21879_c0_g1_i1.p1 TRINITY_DN21879_c0_g1~~TRINITY_DN21879_c0_g1_i1.p1  ORF type:complete len:316 (-),score=42.79 TRINITY_DN21879_c0_g1_i1:92-1039(-)
MLEGNGERIGLMTDEGGVVLNSDLIGENGVLNIAWDGGTLSLDRANGTSIVARNPRVTALLMVQPDVLDAYRERKGVAARGSGLLARFLIARPPSLKGQRFIVTTQKPRWEHLEKFHERLRELLQQSDSTENDGSCFDAVLDFDNDAATRWIYYANAIEAAMQPNGGLDDIPDFASKAMENVTRLSGLFHIATKQEGKITLDTLERAYAIVIYHVHEAKRLLSTEPALAEIESDCQKLERYLRDKVQSGWYQLPRRYIYRSGPIRDKLRFDAAIFQLTAAGKIWITLGSKQAKFVNLNSPYFASLPLQRVGCPGP